MMFSSHHIWNSKNGQRVLHRNAPSRTYTLERKCLEIELQAEESLITTNGQIVIRLMKNLHRYMNTHSG